MRKFDYSKSKVGINHTLEFAQKLQLDYVTIADIPNNPDTHAQADIGQGDISSWTVDWIGSFEGKDVSKYLPTSSYIFSLDANQGFSYQIYGEIADAPIASDFVAPYYSTYVAAEAAVNSYLDALDQWWQGVDAATTSKVVFRGANSGEYGVFTFDPVVSANDFGTYMGAFTGAETVIGSSYDDQIYGGLSNDLLNGGDGKDTIIFDDVRPVVGLATSENKNNDSKVILKTADGQDTVIDAELGSFKDGVHSLQKIYIDILRNADGTAVMNAYENGKLLYGGIAIHWDNATPIPVGEYYAHYKNAAKLGKVIELGMTPASSVITDDGNIPRSAIYIHTGLRVGISEGCFIAGERDAFLGPLFQHLAEQASGFATWAAKTGVTTYNPVVPITVNVHNNGTVLDPVLIGKDYSFSDATASTKTVVFDLKNDNGGQGLADKKMTLFFKAGGDAQIGSDWKFSAGSGVSTFYKAASAKDTIYKVELEAGANHVSKSAASFKIDILANSKGEKLEHIKFDLVDIDLWRLGSGSKWTLYDVSKDSDTDSKPNLVEAQFFTGDHTIDVSILADTNAKIAHHDDLFV